MSTGSTGNTSSATFGALKKAAVGLSFAMALVAAIYHLQLVVNGMPEAFKFRSTHLFLLLPLAFLIRPSASEKRPWLVVWDLVMFATSFVTCGLLCFVWYGEITTRMPKIDELPASWIAVATILLVCVLEATRRIVGWSMVLICLAAMAYALRGDVLTGALAYSGSTYEELIDQIVFTTEGLFGIPLAASSTFIFLFILFGKFLERSGAGQMFIDLSFALAGKSRGGPAKVAVVSSAFMGSISGSATANVVSTGVYTIPLMKTAGYKPAMAGAVEAAASTGGQILPPVMGAAAFLLAEFAGIPYTELILIAAIPALLYFLGVGAAVHFEAVKMDMKGLAKEKIPPWSAILKRIHLILPLFIVVIVMFMGYTPYLSAVIALVSVLVTSALQKDTRMGARAIIQTLVDGTKDAATIAITTAAAGIVIGVASETGLGVKFASVVLSTAGNNLILLLVFIMIASLILGMGLPTSAAYILIVAIALPNLINAGVMPIAAHLFVLYFGVFSAITPPVAISSYTAAGMAKANPLTTSFIACRLCLPAFIIPYVFVYHPALILQGTVMEILIAVGTTTLGVIILAAALTGTLERPLGYIQRALMIGLSCVLMFSNQPLLMAGAVAAVIAVVKIPNLLAVKRASR